jgi:polysaccharide export outer membrane protein
LAAVPLFAQQPVRTGEVSNTSPSNSPTSLAGEDYRIGIDDSIDIQAFHLSGINTSARVSAGGKISYTPVGELQVLGLTQQDVASIITEKLKATGIKNPKVQVAVKEYASQPVSIVGAVRRPDIYQIKGHKTLIDMLAMAGDRGENAGELIQVLRGDSTIVIDLVALYQNGNAELNIPIYSGDKIIVLEAKYITVVGEVMHQGKFPLKFGETVNVLDAWALGGGETANGRKKESVILREHTDGRIEEIPVNFDKVMSREIPPANMLPGDVLYVPSSGVRSAARRVLDSLITVGIGRAVYAR